MPEQLPYGRVADDEALLGQFGSQVRQALTRPAQGRHRIPSARRLHKGFERGDQCRLLVYPRFSSGPGLSLPSWVQYLAAIQFLEAVANGAVREPGGLSDCDDSTTA